jgi:flagellar hook protein FlgE
MHSILIDPSSTKIKIGVPAPENYTKGGGKALYTALLDDIKASIKSINGKDDDVVVSISTISKITTDTITDAPAFSSILLTLDQKNGTRPAIREYVTHGTITRSGLGELEFDHNNIYINDGDGKYLVGRLVPVVFTNNNGLEPMGDNLLAATERSGTPIYNLNNNKTADIKSNTLELSTADLSVSLVNLMVFQRAFEANAKSITTADSILNTLINLKR